MKVKFRDILACFYAIVLIVVSLFFLFLWCLGLITFVQKITTKETPTVIYVAPAHQDSVAANVIYQDIWASSLPLKDEDI